MASHEQIVEIAYFIWQEEGCPHGRDINHYFQAKRLLEERELSPSKSEKGSSPSEKAAPPDRVPKSRAAGSPKPRSKKSR
jgi:hypothetical protein